MIFLILIGTVYTAHETSSSRQDNLDDFEVAEGSNVHKIDEDSSDDPFVNTVSKNAMPVPPSKEKKEYLEDYENFSIK